MLEASRADSPRPPCHDRSLPVNGDICGSNAEVAETSSFPRLVRAGWVLWSGEKIEHRSTVSCLGLQSSSNPLSDAQSYSNKRIPSRHDEETHCRNFRYRFFHRHYGTFHRCPTTTSPSSERLQRVLKHLHKWELEHSVESIMGY